MVLLVALVLVFIVLFVNFRLRDSRLGRAWIALREDEVAQPEVHEQHDEHQHERNARWELQRREAVDPGRSILSTGVMPCRPAGGAVPRARDLVAVIAMRPMISPNASVTMAM